MTTAVFLILEIFMKTCTKLDEMRIDQSDYYFYKTMGVVWHESLYTVYTESFIDDQTILPVMVNWEIIFWSDHVLLRMIMISCQFGKCHTWLKDDLNECWICPNQHLNLDRYNSKFLGQ